MKDIMKNVTESQQAFIKTILGMYITNNILDGSDRADVEGYINGMIIKDEFYYLINYIVDEVIKEPEWVVFLEANGWKEDSYTVDGWNDIFTEVLKTITYEFLYPNADNNRNEEINEFRKQFDAELIVQAEIRKKKEEEEEKKRKEEEDKRKKEEEEKKAAEGAEDAEAVEIKDSSVSS